MRVFVRVRGGSCVSRPRGRNRRATRLADFPSGLMETGLPMKKTWMVMAACSAVGACWPGAYAAETAQMVGPTFPDFQTAAQVRQACDAGLRAAKARVTALEKEPASPGWIGDYDAFYS